MFREEITELFEKMLILSNETIRDMLMLNKGQYAVLNTELKRMCDEKCIVRVGHGIYIMPKQTKWGTIYPTEKELTYNYYIAQDEGYLSGCGYYNAIGISTWIPNKREITTNRYGYKLTVLKNTELLKPKIKITGENKKYLQLLDGIHYLGRNHCDASDPVAIFAKQVLENKLDEIRLVLYAHNLYPKYVLDYVLKIVEVNHNEFAFKQRRL